MKWFLLIILLFYLSSRAIAQTVTVDPCVSYGYDLHGNRVCTAIDLVNRNPIFPEPPRVMPQNGVTISSHALKCREGYSMILRSPGDPACARDIINPE